MKKLLAILLLAVLSVSVMASPVDSYMIPLQSGFYDDIDALSRMIGIMPPSYARPWSRAEADLALSRIEREEIPESAIPLYEKVKEELEDMQPRWMFSSDTFGFGSHLKVQPEMYVHTNGKEFRSDESWIYSFDDRQPFLYLGLEMSAMDFFYTYCDLMYTMGRHSVDGLEMVDITSPEWVGVGAIVPKDPPEEWKDVLEEPKDAVFAGIVTGSEQYFSTVSFNIPPQSSKFEFEWPKRALVSFGGDSWNLMVGRDRINWGGSEIGNFVLDGHVGYHDMARLSIFTDIFRYEWTNIFFETNYGSSETRADESIRMLMAHRLEFRFLPWLDFVISENVMYSAPSLNLKYLNPGNIYHNLNNAAMFNAIAYAELSAVPVKGLEIYSQAVLDQATAPNESNSQAPAWGLSIGSRYTHPLSLGYLEAAVEGVYTSPELYRRDGVDFLMFQRVFTFDEGRTMKLYYIGFPYGGDTIMLHTSLTWRIPDTLTLSFIAEGFLKGEMDMLHSHNVDGDNTGNPNYMDPSPSGNDVTRVIMLSLYGCYEFPELWDFLRLSAWSQISFAGCDVYHKDTGVATDARGDFQFVIGFSIKV